jgi:predicted ABC-type exoprotein transport system permease subunit
MIDFEKFFRIAAFLVTLIFAVSGAVYAFASALRWFESCKIPSLALFGLSFVFVALALISIDKLRKNED